MINNNIYNNSTYSLAVKNEMKKVNTNANLCCNFSGTINENYSDSAKLLSDILIDNGNCDFVTEDGVITNITERSDTNGIRNCERRGTDNGDLPVITFEEEAGIVNAVEREQEWNSVLTNTAEITGNVATARVNMIRNENIRNNFRRGNYQYSRYSRCRFCRRRNRCRYMETDIETIEINENQNVRNTEFTDQTTFYRFINQNLLDNMTGKSNINVTNLNNNTAEKRIQVDQIMKKYGRHK